MCLLLLGQHVAKESVRDTSEYLHKPGLMKHTFLETRDLFLSLAQPNNTDTDNINKSLNHICTLDAL